MIALDEALDAYAAALRPLPIEPIATPAAYQRVLARPACAASDLPRFDQSAMDGYALRAADIADASPEQPGRLPIVLHLAARGGNGPAQLPAVSAARILTGAAMPLGADTVIPQERVRREAEALLFTEPYPAARNIRYRAEELVAGTVLAKAGQRIGAGLLASLVNASVAELAVHARPRLAVLSTGDELRPAGTPLQFGQIHDSNGPLIAAVLRGWQLDAEVRHVGDDPEQVEQALRRALDEADLVISAGGASVGDHDHLPATAERLGLRRVFWQVAQKPGKPMWFGVGERGGRQRAMLALPGNPGAVLAGLCLHVRRVLDVLEGVAAPQPRWQPGVVTAEVQRDARRERLLRMRLEPGADGCARLYPLPGQDSHMLANLAEAAVLVRVAAGSAPVVAGTLLPWTALPM